MGVVLGALGADEVSALSVCRDAEGASSALYPTYHHPRW